jgi:MFS family permease
MRSSEEGRVVGLWRHRDFRRLWAGETVSLFGSEVTELALPLVAVLVLDAGAAQMGLLAAARFAPFLLVTLPAGVWVDTHRRRPVLIGGNLGRCLLVALVPLLAGLGVLRIQHLYAIAFAVGALTVLFDVAYQSYLPTLVTRPQLVEGNSKLQASASVARVGGPGLGGLLVQLVGAPRALLLDAATFAVSMSTLLAIRHREPDPADPHAEPRAGLRREIAEGLRVTYRDPVLRSMAGLAATYNLFDQVMSALLVLYATTELGMSAALIGLVVSAGSLGALAGAALTGRLEHRLGVGRSLIVAVVVESGALLLVPVAGGPPALAAGLLGLAFVGNGFGLGLSNVLAVSLRQAVTPDRLLGRMNASYRFLTYGVVPLGALLGGALGELLGLRGAVAVGAVGSLLAVPWTLLPPLPRLGRMPVRPAQPGPR